MVCGLLSWAGGGGGRGIRGLELLAGVGGTL